MRGMWSVVLVLLSVATANAQELEGLAAEAFAAEKATWQSEVDGDVVSFRHETRRELLLACASL